MDEQTQTPPDAGASAEAVVDATAAAPASPLSDEQKLERLLRRLTKGLVAAVVIFAVVYFFGQRQSHVEQAASAPDLAIASAEASVRSDPNDVTARLKLAESYATAQRIDDALTQLSEILRVDPKNRPALLGTGELLRQQGKLEQARDALNTYVATVGSGEFSAADPKLQRAYYDLGAINLDLGDAKEAARNLNFALQISRTDADALALMGRAQLQLKDYTLAEEAFSRAILFVPNGWCSLYEGLGQALKGLGDADGVTYAESMVRVCNGSGNASAESLKSLLAGKWAVNALYGLGVAAENDKDSELALHYFQQVLTLDRTNIAALSEISRLGATPKPEPIGEK